MHEIARAGGLQERYVREWLAAMLVGGIVEHDPAKGTWHLPAEHAAVLTRRAGKDNLAKMAQLIGLLAGAERAVATCFRDGGGVPYSAYTEFHALMAEDSKDLAEGILVDEVLPLVDGLTKRLERGISVADVGCGSGHHLNVLAGTFPDSRFVGYDFSEEAITEARADAAAKGLTNVRFELQRRRRPDRHRAVRPHHGLRRDPRPGAPGSRARRDRAGARPRRRVPHGGHPSVQQPARECGRPRRRRSSTGSRCFTA